MNLALEPGPVSLYWKKPDQVSLYFCTANQLILIQVGPVLPSQSNDQNSKVCLPCANNINKVEADENKDCKAIFLIPS